MNETTILAAGCFWGVQYYFDQVPGVISTEVGYIGGKVEQPSYEMVCYDNTHHAEAVKIEFDPNKISLKELLMQFFRMHDPTQLNRQGPDVGDQYRSAIFYGDENQQEVAQNLIDELNASEKFSKPVATTLEKATTFWPGEDYHQKYTKKTGRGMCHIPYSPV